MNSKYSINELFRSPKDHLPMLKTADGEKSFYDAVSRCLRCGYCQTVCPTYSLTSREALSPRGRNQLVRSLVEGKIQSPEYVKEALNTCLLCGACSYICYGKVPTSEIVLEARREISGHGKSFYYKVAAAITSRKKVFNYTLKFLYILKKLKLDKLSDTLGLFKLLNMQKLSTAQKKEIKTPLKFLTEELESDERLKKPSKISWIYFSACGLEFIYTDVGKATVDLLLKIYGEGVIMKNECCGLIAYNYGCLQDAIRSAVKNMEIYENLISKFSKVPIIVDCSSCCAFLKNYPSLFHPDDPLRKKAQDFSDAVKDITEFIKFSQFEHLADPSKFEGMNVTIHDSCRASYAQGIRKEIRDVLKPLLKDSLKEMPESDHCCGGAGAFAFTNAQISEKILEKKIKNISSVRADIVIASSTSCLIQIEKGLKELYPKAKIMHYSLFLKSLLK